MKIPASGFSVQEGDDGELRIDVLPLKKAALILRAANHQLRQQMLPVIHQQGRINVTEICILFRLEQSVASQQLAILRRAGLVTTKRAGKHIFYSVDYGRLDEIQPFVHGLLN